VLVPAFAATALLCAPVTQKVLVFNIEYGGALVDFAKTAEVVERAAPDIVRSLLLRRRRSWPRGRRALPAARSSASERAASSRARGSS
jgi:hypothetical protein